MKARPATGASKAPAPASPNNRASPRLGSPEGGKRRKPGDQAKLRTKDGYKEYRQANDQNMGAPPPSGVDVPMSLTGASDLKTAFDMLDERKEGALDRNQSRKWLRCAGWCVTDEVLDQMLTGVDNTNAKKRLGGATGERTKWGLRQLTEIAENSRDKDNSSLEEVQKALRRLAGNKSRISRDRLLEFTVQEKGLAQEDLDEVLDILGMSGVKILDCDQLAEKLLYRICNPPSVFEQQTY